MNTVNLRKFIEYMKALPEDYDMFRFPMGVPDMFLEYIGYTALYDYQGKYEFHYDLRNFSRLKWCTDKAIKFKEHFDLTDDEFYSLYPKKNMLMSDIIKAYESYL